MMKDKETKGRQYESPFRLRCVQATKMAQEVDLTERQAQSKEVAHPQTTVQVSIL